MRRLDQKSYTEAEVLRFLAADSRKVSFRYELTDREGRSLGDVTASGNISYDTSAEVAGYGSFNIREIREINYIDERIKPYFRLFTPEGWLEYPLGVYLIMSPDRSALGGTVYREIEAYDRSIILKEDKFESRYIVRAGERYINAVKQILTAAGIQLYDIEDCSAAVAVDVEFEIGTTKLKAVNILLDAINYVPLHFNAYGYAVSYRYKEAMERDADREYETGKHGNVYPGAVESKDAYNCPNVITRYLTTPERETMSATYVNDNPTSLLSTVSRGRRIVDVERMDDIADQETLNQYVRRIAMEKMVYQTIKFDTALMPGHEYRDCIMIRNDELELTGKYVETAWSMDLKVGGKMRHTCRRAVSL